jgi:Ni,Fe-hydrogenase maturation factor
MPLFPQLGPEYYNEQDRGILDRMMAFYAESISINQSFWTEADTDTRFLTGDQTVWNDIYGNLPANRRRSFSFNRIRRVVEMISGHQRRNRKSTIVVPVENADEGTADQYSKILLWCNQQEGVLETISDAFHGALGTGMNLLQVWLDFRSDPISGNIKVDNCSYNSFLIDPFFRKHDLSDCNAIWKRSFLTKGECASLLPDKVDQIMQLMGNDNRDGKFQFMPENYNYGMKNLLTYDEYYYRDYRKQKMLVDSQTGESQEWRGQDEDMLKIFLQHEPSIAVIDQEIPTVRLAIVVQGKVMYDGPNPLNIDLYPFVPVMAYYTPEMPYFPGRVQGVVRGLRDAQYLYNRRKAIELDILESQINSGWKYKESSLVNPRDIFLSGQGRGLALKEEAQMSDVEQIIPPQVPPSMIQLSEILSREVQEISGVNEELLGSAIDDKAGILSMLRQGAGLTTLQRLFDQLDRSQKLLGKIMIDVIQSNFTPGKIKKIIQEEPAPQFYNKAFGKYDSAVEEGINSTTQKQMELAQLLQLRELGIPIPDSSIIDAVTVQDKRKLMAAMEQEKQQMMQQQQAQMQVAEQEAQSRIQLAQARAQADQGLGAERYSRIQENQALAEERRAAAIKDHELGLLNLVKAMKELDGMDINHLAQLVTVAKTLKDASAIQDVQQRQMQQPDMQEQSQPMIQ